MQQIDRKKFFDKYREGFGSLAQPQVDGINQILGLLRARLRPAHMEIKLRDHGEDFGP